MSLSVLCPSGLAGTVRGMRVKEERILADRQLATPEVIYDLAKCHEKLGDVAFATYYYRLYLKRSPAARHCSRAGSLAPMRRSSPIP